MKSVAFYFDKISSFIFAGILSLIFLAFIVTFVNQSGFIRELIAQRSKKKDSALISSLTREVLLNSSFSGPFFSLVERSDGSFSYAIVEKGSINKDHFIDEIQLLYPNNDRGNVGGVRARQRRNHRRLAC